MCVFYAVYTVSNAIGKHRALSREVTCNFRLYLKIGRASVDSTAYSRDTTVVYAQEHLSS